jgi:hypothetical protein
MENESELNRDKLLLKRLKSRKPSVREEAERELSHFPPERLLSLLESEAQAQQRRYQWVLLAERWNWLLTSLVAGFGTMTMGNSGEVYRVFLMALMITTSSFLAPTLMFLLGPSKALETVFRVGQKQNSMAVLRCCLRLYGSGMSYSVRDYLLKNLTVIHASEGQRWTIEDRKSLLALLNDAHMQPELAKTVLKVLEQIGGTEAVTKVKELASGRKKFGLFWFRLKPDVQQAAQECLPYLQQNIVLLSQEKTLLRAAEMSPKDSSKTLLRPAAQGDKETDSTQLLRAASEEA